MALSAKLSIKLILKYKGNKSTPVSVAASVVVLLFTFGLWRIPEPKIRTNLDYPNMCYKTQKINTNISRYAWNKNIHDKGAHKAKENFQNKIFSTLGL